MKKISEFLKEGNQGSVSNPYVTKAYGTKTFNDLYNKLVEDMPDIMKTVTGWYLGDKDDKLILKLITKKNAIVGVGLSGKRLMPYSSKAIFKISDLKK